LAEKNKRCLSKKNSLLNIKKTTNILCVLGVPYEYNNVVIVYVCYINIYILQCPTYMCNLCFTVVEQLLNGQELSE